jgi:signal transduction histidine kinase
MRLSHWRTRFQALVPTYFILRTALLMVLGVVALCCVLMGVFQRQKAPVLLSTDPLVITSALMTATVLLANLYLLLIYPLREAVAYPRHVRHPLLLALGVAALLLYGIFVQLGLRAGGDAPLLLSASAVMVGALSGLSWVSGIGIMLLFNGVMTLLLPRGVDLWFWGFLLCAQWVVYVLFKALIGEFHTKTLLFHRLIELQATQRLLRESVEQDLRYEIARNLHDEIGHLATRLSLTLSRMDTTDLRCKEAQTLTRELHHQIRTLASGWSSEPQLDIKAAIEALVQPIAQPRISLTFEGFSGKCAPAIAEVLFRGCQEGITNCLRHSDASQLHITLSRSEVGYLAELRDNGRSTWREWRGSGLKGIETRVRQLGGVMECKAHADGFRLAFSLPESSHTGE